VHPVKQRKGFLRKEGCEESSKAPISLLIGGKCGSHGENVAAGKNHHLAGDDGRGKDSTLYQRGGKRKAKEWLRA